MEPQVQEKLNPPVASQRMTARRAAMADAIVQEGRKLRRVQVGLRAIAHSLETETCAVELAGITGKGQVYDLLTYKSLSQCSATLQKLLKDQPTFEAARQQLEALLSQQEPQEDPKPSAEQSRLPVEALCFLPFTDNAVVLEDPEKLPNQGDYVRGKSPRGIELEGFVSALGRVSLKLTNETYIKGAAEVLARLPEDLAEFSHLPGKTQSDKLEYLFRPHEIYCLSGWSIAEVSGTELAEHRGWSISLVDDDVDIRKGEDAFYLSLKRVSLQGDDEIIQYCTQAIDQVENAMEAIARYETAAQQCATGELAPSIIDPDDSDSVVIESLPESITTPVLHAVGFLSADEADVLLRNSHTLGFLRADEADALLQHSQSLPWRHNTIKMYGKEIPLPRREIMFGDAGCSYQYNGVTLEALPWTPELQALREKVEAATGYRYQAVIGNLYQDGGDHIGWHSDDSAEMGDSPAIASISLGATRRFSVRDKTTKKTQSFDLQHGSLLFMPPGYQSTHLHKIHKTTKPVGLRINWTFRPHVGAKLATQEAIAPVLSADDPVAEASSTFSKVPEPTITPEPPHKTPPLGCVVHVNQHHDLYVGRANASRRLEGSKWQNPYRIGRDGDRPTVLQKFERHLLGRADLMAALEELRGKRIACWCCKEDEMLTADDPLKCHGQILLKALRGDYRDESGSVLEHLEKPSGFRFEPIKRNDEVLQGCLF